MNFDYKLSKTLKKTANENNLIYAERNQLQEKLLFDFSFLNGLDIPDEEKEVIKENGLLHCSCANHEGIYGKEFNNFHSCMGFSLYEHFHVFNEQTGKRLYSVMILVAVKHYHQTRKTTWQEKYDYVETKEHVRIPYGVIEDKEI